MIGNKLPRMPIKGHPYYHDHGEITGDGIPLFSQQYKFYPGKKWYQKIGIWFKYLFHRPKFSAGVLEPAEKIIDHMMCMMHDQNNHPLRNIAKPIVNESIFTNIFPETPKFSLSTLEAGIEAMKRGTNKQPLAMSKERMEDFKKLPKEQQDELLDMYNDFL